MDSKITFNIGTIDTVYQRFKVEWDCSKDTRNMSWEKFIKSLDLGIEYQVKEINGWGETYKIVDEKKWLYNRLKYGI